MEQNDYAWLVSAAAEPWLRRAAEAGDVTLRLMQSLRRDLSQERAHLVVEQMELRRRARPKFRDAEQMFFTRQGLEQATDEILAAVKAERYPAGASVVDLCCGIGGDLRALGQRGPALGVERDPVTALLAAANCERLGCTKIVVETSDAAAIDVSTQGGWHSDPDRRASGNRTTHAEWFEPPPTVFQRWIETGLPGALKVAPATDWPPTGDSAFAASTCERQWLGSRGECRQQVIWTGTAAAHPGRRTALVCDSEGITRTLIERPHAAPRLAERLGRYLFEAHAAVLAARLIESLAEELMLAELPAARGYLTDDQARHDALVDCYEVLDVLPLDRRRVKRHLQEQDCGEVIVKKRGIELDPAQLAREWRGSGKTRATVIVARWEESVVAIVCRPLRS